MQEEQLIRYEKEMIKANVKLFTRRLNYLMNYCKTDNIEKEIFIELIEEISDNIKTETQNYILNL